MDLTLFFDPIELNPLGSFGKTVDINHAAIPDYEMFDIVIIGLYQSDQDIQSTLKIRKELYQLAISGKKQKIADLGNLRKGPTIEETYKRLSEVCALLLEANTFPIIIGGSQEMMYGQYMAYQKFDKLVTLTHVNSKIDLLEGDMNHFSAIHKIFMHEPNYLFNYQHIGYQSYLVENDTLQMLKDFHYPALRIGEIRKNMEELEPYIRDADMLGFDLTALQTHYYKDINNQFPFGLTGEEACQITWYAGQNEKLSSLGLYGKPADDTSAFVVATMIWYFIEGFYHRKSEKGYKSNDFVTYIVALDTADNGNLIFYKSKITERWWMEVPQNSTLPYTKKVVIPCSSQDYETAIKGEIPYRWIQAQNRSI